MTHVSPRQNATTGYFEIGCLSDPSHALGQKAMKCGLGGFPHEQLHQEICFKLELLKFYLARDSASTKAS